MTEPSRITAHTKIVDHEADGLALFYREFRQKDRLKALVRAWLTQAQELEDAVWDVLSITIDTADDDALDQYGDLLVFSRGTLSAPAYRAVLRALIRARKSSATPEDVIAVATLGLGAVSFTYSEGYASVMIRPTDPIGYEAAALYFVLRLAKPGGVQIQLLDPPSQGTADTFAFSSSDFLVQADANRGWSDTSQSSGGYLAGVVG